jgi:hypothetical protein
MFCHSAVEAWTESLKGQNQHLRICACKPIELCRALRRRQRAHRYERINTAPGANPAQVTVTIGYTYDSASHITAMTYPSGRKLSIAYASGLQLNHAKATISLDLSSLRT